MLEKLEIVLEDSKVYQLEECTIDALMRLDSDSTSCIECLYVLCGIEAGMICGIELNDDLDGIR